MTTEERPEALYRGVKGSRAGTRATIVCALRHDGVTPVPIDANRVSWTARAATMLGELGREGADSGSARGTALPYASLRAAIATSVPEAVLLERDLGSPWSETPRPFLDVASSDGLAVRLGRALTLWAALALRPWAEKVGASEELVDALHGLGADAFAVVRREGDLPDVLAAGGSFPELRDAIVHRFAQALEGRELFEGLGPSWRIVRARSNSNELEFTTWPAQHDEALYSMVATITVETVPFAAQPIVTVRASRRRWLGEVPSGRSLVGQRGVTVTLMGRGGPNVALEVSAPVRSQEVQDPVAPAFLGQLLRLGADLAAPLSELVGRGSGGEAFVGIAYSPKLGGRHPIGAGVSTRDQTDLFDAVQEAMDELGFVPLPFEETASLKRVPKRSAELHKALEVEALLSDVAISIGRNDLEDDASIGAAWTSLGLDEEAPAVGAASATKAREKLAEVRSANIERVARVFGDRRPSVVVIARTDGERQLLQSVLASLFGSSIEVSPRPLPQDVHGARSTLPVADGKTTKRFEARVGAWGPLAELLGKMDGGCHALVQAGYWYDGKPDDPVNKLAGRYALASGANANVQYLRPREAGQRGFANYLHRVQAAIYDLVFGHAGLVSDVSGIIAETFPDAKRRPTSLIGISVLTQARTRMSGKSGKLCIATRIDCESGRTTARVGWHDGEMRWSAAWEPLFEALKRIASPSIKASLGSGIANERASFQAFVREILDDCAEVGERPLVMIDSTSAASLWPWLTDGQLGSDITLGSERLDVSRRWPGIRLVRIRLGHAARIAESKTADYRRVDTTTGDDTDEIRSRYCPTIVARTVRLSSGAEGSGHYWSTTGYFQMSLPRGLSVYRTLPSFVPVAKAFRDAPLPPTAARLFVPVGISIFDVSYRLPNPVEITVATVCEGDDPDGIAHLVASLRYGYGHTAASTSLPAPLSFESKARDYMTRFALDVTEEEDDEAAEIGSATTASEDGPTSDEVETPEEAVQLGYDRAWRELVDERDVSLMDSASLAAAQLATGEFASPARDRDISATEHTRAHSPGAQAAKAVGEPGAATWSELDPVIRLPDFVTLEWLTEYVAMPNTQLRAAHQARSEIARLSGYAAWPVAKPDRAEFLAILLEGLRYPRFAAAVTQAAVRSLAPAKRLNWTPFKPLLHLAYARSQTILTDQGLSASASNSTRGVAETLAGAGDVDLALAHVFRRAYMEPLQPDMLALIRKDDRFAPLRDFASDATLHLFRQDYEWGGDLGRFPARPVDELPTASVSPPAIVAPDESASCDEGAAQEDNETLEAVPPAVDGETSPPDGAPIPVGEQIRDDDPQSDGGSEWVVAMASIVAVASRAAEPGRPALDLLAAHVSAATGALARWEASRPKGVDAMPLVDHALQVYALALGVMVDAEEVEGSFPAAPNGPFVEMVEAELGLAVEADLAGAADMAAAGHESMVEVRRIAREMQMSRLQEAVSLKADAVASGRAAAETVVEVLGRLRTAGADGVPTGSAADAAEGEHVAADVTVAVDDDPHEGDGHRDPLDLEWDSSIGAALEENVEPTGGEEQAEHAGQPHGINVTEHLASAESVTPPDLDPDPDPMGPQLLRRFVELVEAGRYGLAYHLSSAASAAGLYSDFPLTSGELRLAAIAGHANHASLQGGDLVHSLLTEAYGTFEDLDDDARDAVARRIMALASLAPFALYHNDPEAKLALEALRQVGDGLGEAVHAFREALAGPLQSGLSLSPALMRLAGEDAQEDEYARDLLARILSELDDFSKKTYKFQLGNKLRNVLLMSDGELGRLRDRVTRGGSAALDATREFAGSYGDRPSTLRLLAEAESRTTHYRLTGIDGIARDRMVGLIQGIASLCAEYVETADAAPAMKGTRATIQRARSAIVDATSALDSALDRFEPSGPLERAAVAFAREALAALVDTVNGVGTTPAPTDHLLAVHGPLLWLPSLDFGQGWLPAPFVPEVIVGAILDATPPQNDGPADPVAFAVLVEQRIATGSHIAASMMISAADFLSVPADVAETLSDAREADVATRRDALTSELRDARLMVDRVQRMSGVGSQDQAQALLSLLDRISPEDLPTVVPLESRTEVPETEQILDFRAAYGLVSDVRTKVDMLLKRPRDALFARIADLAKVGSVIDSDLDKVRGLVARDDLLTAAEYLEFLEDGRALPETTSPNPRFRSYFPRVPELLTAMSRAEQDGIGKAILNGGQFAGLDFDKMAADRRADATEALDAWNELRRVVGAGRAEVEVASRLARVLDRFGLEADLRSPNAKGRGRTYSADMRIELLRDSGSVLLPDFGSQTGGDYRVCVGSKVPSDAEARAIQADAGALRVVFIVTDTVSPERRRQLQLWCLENSTRLLVIDESMIFFALAEPEPRGLTLFELAQPFSFADPYHDYGNAAVPREMFFGRATERRKLLEPHGSCIVYGGRRLGKTALLRHIQAETDDAGAGMAVAYVNIIDLGGNAAENQIWEYVSRELKTVFAKPVDDSERFSDTLRQWLDGDSKRRVLVLLDESDRFIQADAGRGFAQFVRLQKLMDDTNRRFKFVLAGLHNVTRLVHTENPPLKQIASDPQRIGPLMDEELGDAEALVTRPLAGMGYEFENREDVWRILSYCNYYPVLVQQFCKELVTELVRETVKRRRAVGQITSEHIRAALEDERIADEIGETFDYTISKIEDRYSLIANIVADRALRDSASGRIGEGMSGVEVRDAAASWWPAAFSEANRLAVVEDLLDEMEGLGVLRRVPPNRWALRSPTILRLLGHDDEIAAKLGEFMNRPAPPVFDPRSMRRRLKANVTMRVPEGAICPLTLGQEHDLLRDRTAVTLVFGNTLSDIGMVTGALVSAALSRDERGVGEVSPRSFPSADAMVKDLAGAAPGQPPILHVVHDLSPWNAGWVERALRVRAVRDGRARFLFVGRAEHALSWISDGRGAALAREVKTVPLQTWSATLTDEMLQQEHLDPKNFRTLLREATGGYNQLMQQLFAHGSSVTKKGFATRLQAATTKRRREPGLPAELGLVGDMLDVFRAIAEFTDGDITAYEVAEGPVVDLGLGLSGQSVVEFGVLMGLLEAQAGGSVDAEDARPFRLNPLLHTVFGPGSAQ